MADTSVGVHDSDFVSGSFDAVKAETKRRKIPSASSALVIGGILGILQAIFLISCAKPLLNFMGVKSVRTFVTLIWNMFNVSFSIL